MAPCLQADKCTENYYTKARNPAEALAPESLGEGKKQGQVIRSHLGRYSVFHITRDEHGLESRLWLRQASRYDSRPGRRNAMHLNPSPLRCSDHSSNQSSAMALGERMQDPCTGSGPTGPGMYWFAAGWASGRMRLQISARRASGDP